VKDVYVLMVQVGVYICSEHITSSENSSTSLLLMLLDLSAQ
jgi:hypothetical protein